ncbi:predicted protein [Thalassiosira pseudonana CCMP1335]|uniref:Ubiquitin carboxyl-terminal hydrolase n=1 Tax=Thalassiosira pseudonana TaxID=35128 RepID=B8BX32_THAPS|nr:predicted protein [Thalassiosira pseudonana CCMP1335]EED93637.1 predicted protein [Thalassiosira pseudonana CCMP1335]
MPTYATSVKWGKETITLDLDPTANTAGLKSTLQSLTGVPVDRMKLMPKSKGLWKGVLKDDFDLSSIDLSTIGEPIQMLLMGSATLPVEPVKKTVFLEDLPPEEAAKMVEPSGLVNLGNTCYLNSVLQCLRVIPHLRDGLKRYTPSHNSNNAQQQVHSLLLTSLLSTLTTLDKSPTAISPNNLVMATKMAFPQMAQTGPQGQPMQQDAEEFYSSVLGVCAGELRGENVIKAAFQGGDGPTVEELNGANNVIDAVFGLKMEETLTCDEFADALQLVEPPVTTYDLHRKLVCNIQGGSDSNSQTNVTHIAEGIQLALTGKLEKHSEALGRNAQWTRSQKIARLPPYLVVQFGRFYWKATPDSQDHSGVKCKVMKPVGFQSVLDVYEFCSDKVKSVLKVARDKAAKEEEDRVAKKLKGEDVDVADVAMEEEEELQAALAMSVETEQPPVGPGLPHDFQGLYELFAVVTHKGRDADGGHYMGWVKADNSDPHNDDWFVFDDDEVSPCKTEDILKLKGGGDWHMSYLNFYRAKK